ncbi:shugoshin-like [Drosophila hydei]|uniref:Shugoshin-like n=1 Tax=Drosophila hydei TaxID=7224 RepID=A0A6J1LLA6_DROHY|nr:shugoshin-like [Drosophila hydei]
MEQYKIINAELMDQVQKQRITISEMLKTEVVLKRQLLEEREIRLADAQYNEQKLKCAIRTLLNSLDINFESDEDSRTSQSSKALDNIRASPYNNEQACSELRRSSEILQKTLPLSPIRRSRSSVLSCNSSQDEESENSTTTISPCSEKLTIVRKTPEPRHLVELEANVSSPQAQDSPEPAPTPSNLTPAAAYLYSIIEESEIEESTLSSSVDSNETLQKSLASSSDMEISALPLRDMTNVQNREARLIPTVKITKEQSPSEMTSNKTKKCNVKQTSLDHNNPNLEKTMLGKNESDIGNQEPSIEHVRVAAQTSLSMQVTLPCPSVNVEPVLTPRRSQLNFSSFNGIVNRPGDCSTPRQDEATLNASWKRSSTKARGKQIRCSATTSIAMSRTDETTIEGSMDSRTRRKCRPTTLKEASLRTKLRNQAQTK